MWIYVGGRVWASLLYEYNNNHHHNHDDDDNDDHDHDHDHHHYNNERISRAPFHVNETCSTALSRGKYKNTKPCI